MLSSKLWMPAVAAIAMIIPAITWAQVAPVTTAVITGTVVDVRGNAVQSAEVNLSGAEKARTYTNKEGRFQFTNAPFGFYRIVVTTPALGTASRDRLSVDGDVDIAIQFSAPTAPGLKVIANVSSRPNATFNITPASVTVLNPTTYALQGGNGWRSLLERIPGITTGGSTGFGAGGGSGNDVAIPDSPLNPALVSINGSLPYETATLLDNMPIAVGRTVNQFGTGGTDLSLYPLISFGSADVIGGPGASSPSILNSIGGSLLLNPPGQVSSSSFRSSLTFDPYGGFSDDSLITLRLKTLSATLSYGVNDSPGPANQSQIPFFTATPLTVDGKPFECTATCAQVPANVPGYTNIFTYYNTGLLACCTPPGGTSWTEHSGSFTLTYAPSTAISAEVFYTGLSSVVNGSGGYWADNFAPPAGYTGPVHPGLNNFINLLQFGGALPQSSSLVEEKITANLAGGYLKIAALQNRTWSKSSTFTPASGRVHLFGGGTLNGSPVTFNGESHSVTFDPFYNLENAWSNNRDISLQYTRPLNSAVQVGASYVQSYFDSPLSFTDSFPMENFTFSIGKPDSVSQTSRESRLLLGIHPSKKSTIDLSMYFARVNYHVQDPTDSTGAVYSDRTLSYAAPRLGTVWRASENLALRASGGGGFAAPPLDYVAGLFGFSPNGTPIPNGAPPTSYSISNTNLNLEPEKSFAFDVGADIRLPGATAVSLDLYRANLYGQLYSATTQTGTYQGLPLFATQFNNLGVSRFEGLLLAVHHDVPKGVFWRATSGFTRGYVVSVPGGFYDSSLGPQTANLYVVPGINFNGFFESAVPYSQASATIGYRWSEDRFVDIAPTYYGPNNSYFRPAFVEIDAHVGLRITSQMTVLATLRNATGIYAGSVNVSSPANFWGAPTIKGPARSSPVAVPGTREEQAADVSPNVLVSRDSNTPHHECFLAIDPRDQSHELAAVTTVSNTGTDIDRIWLSSDGGRTWSHRFVDVGDSSGDPQVAFGVSGTSYFSTLAGRGNEIHRLVFFRSRDGGHTWAPSATLGHADHEQMTVDWSNGRRRGRIYLFGSAKDRLTGTAGIELWYSDDDGRTFHQRQIARNVLGTDSNSIASGLQVLRDGALVATYIRWDDPLQHPRADTVQIISKTSFDGGLTWSSEHLVGTRYTGTWQRQIDRYYAVSDGKIWESEETLPMLALNPSDGRGTLYMVWGNLRRDTDQVVISSSSDGGFNWSNPRPVFPDQPLHVSDFQSAVTVSQRSNTVGLIFYRAQKTTIPMRGRFTVYFTASRDRGRSFTRPLRVSSMDSYPRSAGNFRLVHFELAHDRLHHSISTTIGTLYSYHAEGGDYIGFAADSSGFFHPLWTDSRSGTYQLYTTAIKMRTVHRKPMARQTRFEYSNISNDIDLIFGGSEYDQASNDFLIPIMLKNVSSEKTFKNIKVSMTSPLHPELARFGFKRNSVYLKNGVWDLTSHAGTMDYSKAIPTYGLRPGHLSQPILWRVHFQILNAGSEMKFVIHGQEATAHGKQGAFLFTYQLRRRKA